MIKMRYEGRYGTKEYILGEVDDGYTRGIETLEREGEWLYSYDLVNNIASGYYKLYITNEKNHGDDEFTHGIIGYLFEMFSLHIRD